VKYDGGNERNKKKNGVRLGGLMAMAMLPDLPAAALIYPRGRPRIQAREGARTATATPATVRERRRRNRARLSTVAAIPPHSYIFCFLQITPKFA
jgi:hypothetical protein